MFRKVKFILLLLAVFAIGCNSISENEKIIYISEKVVNESEKVVKKEIYSMNINGSDIQRINTSEGEIKNPKLSKNGKYLGFLISKNNDNKELHFIDLESNKKTQITNQDLDVEDFFWSPDSRKLTFKAIDNKNHFIHLYNLDNNKTNKITTTKGIEELELGNWSPDGQWIVYSVNDGDKDKWGIFKKNPDGVDEVRLTENLEDHNPIWSPDGERIAFLSKRGSDNLDIYTLNIENGEENQITYSQSDDSDFSWDPSGKRITFVSNREDNPEIFVIDISSKQEQEPIRLTDNESDERSPIWKENKIIFISNSDGDDDIYSMTPSDGSNQKRLTETNENETEIFW